VCGVSRCYLSARMSEIPKERELLGFPSVLSTNQVTEQDISQAMNVQLPNIPMCCSLSVLISEVT